ncbi:MAG: wax ester/triacylglycerol synthase domain-containing protein, partial [Ilumatobacteraceae bacterium]
MTDIVYGRRMSDAERLMWRLEDDPRLGASFANVSVLDRPPDMDRLRRRLTVAAAQVPRLRQAVRPPPIGFGAPSWADDPDFDVDDHVRRIALPSPGNQRQFLDLAALVAADPLDRSRPLWQFVVVEGLEDGRA